jgi:hypothetical protein
VQTCSGYKLGLKCLLNFERQCGFSAAVMKEKGLCSIAIRVQTGHRMCAEPHCEQIFELKI